MGGQACILHGAAEFSRDIDLAILVSSKNLSHLWKTLDLLQATTAYVPDLTEEVLLRGHACHFRCHAPGLEGLRVDVMGKMRGVADFSELWDRRVEIELPEVGSVPVMGLHDLVKAKKTQRDKDWPMIRRLVESDYHRQGLNASAETVRFWLTECRTPEILKALATSHPEATTEMITIRPLLSEVLSESISEITQALRREEDRERDLDREYWAPLLDELEVWRRTRNR